MTDGTVTSFMTVRVTDQLVIIVVVAQCLYRTICRLYRSQEVSGNAVSVSHSFLLPKDHFRFHTHEWLIQWDSRNLWKLARVSHLYIAALHSASTTYDIQMVETGRLKTL